MHRSLAIVSVALALAAAGAAPKAKDSKSVVYGPTQVGAKLVYKVSDVEWVEEVTAVERTDGATTVTLTRTYPVGTTQPTVYRTTADGLFKVAEGPKTFDPPEGLVRFPVGDKPRWEVGVVVGDRNLRAKAWVVGEEEVIVPAGKFVAVRVDTEYPFGGARNVRASRWYAPGVGLVRETDGEHEIAALKSFTPGPAKK
jgi:hypothetical protein